MRVWHWENRGYKGSWKEALEFGLFWFKACEKWILSFVSIFLLFAGEKQVWSGEQSELSYPGSLGSTTGTGLTLATSSLSSTAALLHHSVFSVPFSGEKVKLLETPQRILHLLSSCLENRWKKMLGCFSHSFSSPEEKRGRWGSLLFPSAWGGSWEHNLCLWLASEQGSQR